MGVGTGSKQQTVDGGSSNPANTVHNTTDFDMSTAGDDYIPQWVAKKGSDMQDGAICRSMLYYFATSTEAAKWRQLGDKALASRF